MRGRLPHVVFVCACIVFTAVVVGRAQAARPILAQAPAISAAFGAKPAQISHPGLAPAIPVPPPFPSPTPVPPPLPLAPAYGAVPGWLHTSGIQILDVRGRPVRLAAVNWYGTEGSDFVSGGLAYRPYMDILRTIKRLGFNTVRIPFSNQMVEQDPVVVRHLEANPRLRGLHAMAILDRIVAGAGQIGLMVILDNHRSEAGWTAQENGLWYDLPRYNPQSWINDWVSVARRYAYNPAVVGFDLRNEPHSNGPYMEWVNPGYLRNGAIWGPFKGVEDAARDWRLAAEQGGNAILAVNPHVLIIVEGTQIYPYANPDPTQKCPLSHADPYQNYCTDLYWWGGNLAGAKDFPVILTVPHQLVYSPHEYGPQMHGQRWIVPTMTEADWQHEMYTHWGYLLQAAGPNTAPIWIGEFGTPTWTSKDVYDTRGNSQGRWFSALVDYLRLNPSVGWGYWSINGTQSSTDTRAYGARDSFGLLTRDWAHVALPPLATSLRSISPR